MGAHHAPEASLYARGGGVPRPAARLAVWDVDKRRENVRMGEASSPGPQAVQADAQGGLASQEQQCNTRKRTWRGVTQQCRFCHLGIEYGTTAHYCLE